MAEPAPADGPALEDYLAYLRFATVSADPARAPEMRACASWLADLLGSWGLRTRLVEGGGPPLVLATTPRTGRHRVLLYGHYDVQPPEPLEAWRSPPFSPVVTGGFVVARGATDNKGQTMALLFGLREGLRAGRLPVDVTVLLDGEEEIGSPHLGAALAGASAELEADTLLVADTSMLEPGVPSLTLGLRGIAALEVVVRGAALDLHSGSFGGAVANPALVLARLLAGLHDERGGVAVAGFYDRVEGVPDAERAAWAALPFTDADLRRAAGVDVLAGESRYTALERVWMRPTAEVNGLFGGYSGPGTKTIIPREAGAKLSFRLVARQEPEEIAALVEADLRRRAPAGVHVDVRYQHGGAPVVGRIDAPSASAARRAIAAAVGRPPSLVREGLSIPAIPRLIEASGADPVLIGLALPDCAAHAPNERFPLGHLALGGRIFTALTAELARAPGPAGEPG